MPAQFRNPSIDALVKRFGKESPGHQDLDQLLMQLSMVPELGMATSPFEIGIDAAVQGAAKGAEKATAAAPKAAKAAKTAAEEVPAVAQKFEPYVAQMKMQLAELGRLAEGAAQSGDQKALQHITSLQKLIGGPQGALAPSWGHELGGTRFEPMFKRTVDLMEDAIRKLRTKIKPVTKTPEAAPAELPEVDWDALQKKFSRSQPED